MGIAENITSLRETCPLDVQSRVRIPKHIRIMLGWNHEDIVTMQVTHEGLLISKNKNMTNINCDMCGYTDIPGITIKLESVCLNCIMGK